MAKIFRIAPSTLSDTHARPLARDRWFGSYQPLLLQMLATPYGRDLLCVDQSLPPINQISHRHVRYIIDERPGRIRSWIPAMQGWGSVPGVDRTYRSEYHIGEKFANVIRFRWEAYLAYAAHLEAQQYDYHRARAAALGVRAIAGGTVTTFYPDPNPESATVDGYVLHQPGSGLTWSTMVGGAGSAAGDTGTGGTALEFQSTGVSNRWDFNIRGIFLFNTAGISDTDNITAATLALMGESKNDPTSNTPDAQIYASNPASNTALVGGDYDSIGTTAFASAIGYSAWNTSADNTFSLVAAGISAIDKAGITKMGSREAKYDAADSSPTWGSAAATRLVHKFADVTGTASDPTLTVTHAAPTFVGRMMVF